MDAQTRTAIRERPTTAPLRIGNFIYVELDGIAVGETLSDARRRLALARKRARPRRRLLHPWAASDCT